MLYGIFQHFNVGKIHSDNGPKFRSQEWLELMSAMAIKVIASAALHSAGKGQIKKLDGTAKIMLERLLAAHCTANLKLGIFTFVCLKNNEQQGFSTTGFKPYKMVFGSEGRGKSFSEQDL
jgi:hypothetical protein